VSSKKKKPLPGWLWLITGLAIGLFVSGLAWLRDQPDDASKQVAKKAREEVASTREVVEEQEEQKPRFDFYTLLPELEVVIPDDDYEVEITRPAQTETATRPVETTGSYRLQAGSFRSIDEADRLRARLILLGVEADIQTVKVNNQTWHRVRVGPFNNLDELNTVRKRLGNHSIQTLVMKNQG
jgi:cell division protein FtsN